MATTAIVARITSATASNAPAKALVPSVKADSSLIMANARVIALLDSSSRHGAVSIASTSSPIVASALLKPSATGVLTHTSLSVASVHQHVQMVNSAVVRHVRSVYQTASLATALALAKLVIVAIN